MVGKNNMIFANKDDYPFNGTWHNPMTNDDEHIDYAIIVSLGIERNGKSGIENIRASVTISVFGSPNIANGDKITLQDGLALKVYGKVSPIYRLPHIAIRKFIHKPIVDHLEVTLQ